MSSRPYGRIVVVDNTHANLQLLTKILTEQDGTVHPAADAKSMEGHVPLPSFSSAFWKMNATR